MSKFHTELLYKSSERPGYFTLTAALHYESALAKMVIIAPRGMETNFVTGRKLLVVRRIVSDKMNRAAVIHDELYGSCMVSRSMADSVFYEAMIVDKVPKWRAILAYGSVRVLGWQFYGGAGQTVSEL